MQHELPLDKDLLRGGCGGFVCSHSLLFLNSGGESEESHEISKPCLLPPTSDKSHDNYRYFNVFEEEFVQGQGYCECVSNL